jgi:hypothetical protein
MIKQNFIILLFLAMFVMPVLGVAQSSVDTAACSEKDAQSLLSAFVSYTDLRIHSVQRSLGILAGSMNARTGNWQKMRGLLSAYQKSDAGLAVWYVRPDGIYYTVDQGLMDKKLTDRSYFPDLMAGKKITGALIISKSTGQRSAVIAVPVKNGDKVIGAIGASLFLDKLAEQINTVLDLRPDVSFFALAPNGLTTLHRKHERHFLDPREMGSESLKKAVAEMLSGTSGKITYEFDNITKHALYQTSALTQWRFAIAFSAVPLH